MCTSPRARCEIIGKTYLTKEGKVAHECDHFAWSEIEKNPEYFKAKYRKVDMYPCGKCMECRLNYSRVWANRLVLESREQPKDTSWFITLTYDDEHLPTHTTVNTDTGEIVEGISLYKKDLQDFIKRLRSYYEYKYNVTGIKYYAAGEYGSEENTNRPHYHICIFGLPLDQTKLKKSRITKLGHTVWRYHEDIEKLWRVKGKKIGNYEIGRFSWEDGAYVARYNVKKLKGTEGNTYYGMKGQIPPFVVMSRRPGIGMTYFVKHKNEIYETDTIPIANKKTMQEMIPPKAFDKAMEKIEPELMEQIKKERKRNAESIERAKNLFSDLEPQERRDIKNKNLKEKMKNLRRDL